ncbi:MAG: hypothetical protein FWG99_11625 [Treponema sp.]|nr:hypothetical protein [Treponema sp.]
MKSKIFFLFIYFFLVCYSLSALGKKEEEEVKTLENEWTLCITNFDTASLPEGKTVAAGLFMRSLVDSINLTSYRLRLSPEYTYHEGYTWAQARSASAKALAAKHEERALLIYRGESQFRYRQNLARVDADIEKLNAAFELVEETRPIINQEPEFRLTQGNLGGTFPEPPRAGAEYSFCQSQRVNAFLQGKIQDFHDRYYVTIKLFTAYTRSYIYEDNIIFSTEDIDNALQEITGRLIAVLAGNNLGAVAVHAEPPETLVLINRSFAGRGSVQPMEYPPGNITITMSAPDYEGETVETELAPGELLQITASLRPLEYTDVLVETSFPAGIYHGALYVGEAPLTLRLPVNKYEYVNVLAYNNETAKTVFLSPETDASASVTSKTRMPLAGERRVNRARNAYYWAWGATWLTGIAAWVSYGLFTSSDEAIRYGYYERGILHTDFSDYNERMYFISMGTLAAFGVAAVYSTFQMFRYMYISSKDAPKIARPVSIQGN